MHITASINPLLRAHPSLPTQKYVKTPRSSPRVPIPSASSLHHVHETKTPTSTLPIIDQLRNLGCLSVFLLAPSPYTPPKLLIPLHHPRLRRLKILKNSDSTNPRNRNTMSYLRLFLATLFICSVSLSRTTSSESSIYEVLKTNGLPMGLLPKGVSNFSLDNSGKFQVHLDRACNAKFENEIHYDMNISGIIRYGRIDGLSGISAQDLFLWFSVIEIRVDVPSSGLIYFNVSVVSKQYSLSSFEIPRDCLAAPSPDLEKGKQIVETLSKIHSEKLLRYGVDHDNGAWTTL